MRFSARTSGLISSCSSRVRISAGFFLKALAKLRVSFLRFCAKHMWISQNSFLVSPWIFGWGAMRILMTAESTFGGGLNDSGGTIQTISGSPNRCTCKERTECLPFPAIIFSATSFCTMKTIVSGGLPSVNCSRRKWLSSGEVM